MTKQVKAAVEVVEAQPAANTNGNFSHLYFTVKTFDSAGEEVGTRIVDLFHGGTNTWIGKHLWWALHNGHTTEMVPATMPEIDNYLATQRQALADKYNAPQKQVNKAA